MRTLYVVLAFGIAMAAWLAGRPHPATAPTRVDIEANAAAVGSWIREQSAALHARTSTLAELPRLAAAVSTDAATVRDLTSDELSFRPQRNETIELGQLRDARVVPLLRIPETSAIATPMTAIGVRITSLGDRLLLTETVPITPREDALGLTGALAVSWSFDATTILAQVRAPGAILSTGGTRLRLGVGVEATARQLELPVATTPGAPTLIAALGAPGRPASWLLRTLAILAATTGIVLLARRRRAPVVAQPAPAPALALVVPPPPTITELETVPAVQSSHFGRYEPLAQLGTGASANVYLARAVGAEGFEKRVALKILHRNLADKPEYVSSFLDEARLASNLTHPNIVQIFDLGRSGDDYFIAMEHVDGCDLERVFEHVRAQRHRMPLDIALGILRRLCDGLDAAHSATDDDGNNLAIVHRDVKPANVLLSRSGSVKVGDFGIAKGAKQQHQSDIRMTKGTIAFMAPEQRMGRRVDPRTDLFAAAAVGYELLAGVEVNLDLQRLLVNGRTGWPHLPALSTVRADAPPELDAILFRALAYDAQDRHASCAAFEDELAQVARTHGLDVTDRELASWLAAEVPEMSPTLRGWTVTAAVA